VRDGGKEKNVSGTGRKGLRRKEEGKGKQRNGVRERKRENEKQRAGRKRVREQVRAKKPATSECHNRSQITDHREGEKEKKESAQAGTPGAIRGAASTGRRWPVMLGRRRLHSRRAQLTWRCPLRMAGTPLR